MKKSKLHERLRMSTSDVTVAHSVHLVDEIVEPYHISRHGSDGDIWLVYIRRSSLFFWRESNAVFLACMYVSWMPITNLLVTRFHLIICSHLCGSNIPLQIVFSFHKTILHIISALYAVVLNMFMLHLCIHNTFLSLYAQRIATIKILPSLMVT